MKLAWKQIEPFVKSPDVKARVVLIYGPDNGLMRERSKIIGKTVVADLSDPFNVITLTASQVLDDPARLSDEARAMSMMGGARLITIENADDKIAPVVREYLEDPSTENLVIIEAGELTPRSPLRTMVEKAGNAAALPCYVEDERGISALVRQMVSEGGYTINTDALNWLSTNIAGDRARARSEIEKLMLYMGSESKMISADDVQAACGEAGAQSLDDLIYAVGGAQSEIALRSFAKLQEEGVSVVAILRSVQNHFRRLHYIKALLADGTPLDKALKALQPPIFFKYEPSFKAQLQRWDMGRLEMVMDKLADLEAQTKKTGTPVETLCAQAVLSISAMR